MVYVPPDGLGTNGIMFIGDSPYTEEVGTKPIPKPFQGAAGNHLDRQLERLHILRQECTVTNAMNCKPPSLGWTDHPERYPAALQSLQQCKPYLDDLIAQRKPKVLVPMGNVALRRVCGVTGMEYFHSYVHETRWGLPAIPTFHPSFLMQKKQKFTSSQLFAFSRAQELAEGRLQFTRYDLLLDQPIDAVRAYLLKDAVIEHLMVDIETPESVALDEDQADTDASYNIIRISFSTELGKSAVTFPWEGAYRDVAREALKRAKRVYMYNRAYDDPRLRHHGCEFTTDVIDVMWAWHFLQSDLPKKLAFSAPMFYCGPPWKNLNRSNPPFYSAMDSAVQGTVMVGVEKWLRAEGRWDAFMRHITQVSPILVKMGAHGVKIDIGAQQQFFAKVKVDYAETCAKIDPLIPVAVKPVKEWKRAPKDMTGVQVEMGPVPGGLKTIGGEPLLQPVKYWKVLPFNLNSSDQVIDLMKHMKLKVPRKRGGEIDPDTGEAKETAESKHLRKLGMKYDVFKLIDIGRKQYKMLTTYQWALDHLMRVYTHYGWSPSTLRKNSFKVNLQNIPKRSDLAQAFRQMIIAADGHVLVEADASAIEAVLVGFDAGSESYVRLSKAGLHGWMTAAYHDKILPIDMEFSALAKACKAAKKEWPADYEVMKRVDHLSNYMGTPERIFEEYPEEFESVAQCAKFQRFYFSTVPGKQVVAWQHAKMDRAHKEKYLLNHFGYKHYFWDVYSWNRAAYRKLLKFLGDERKAREGAWKLSDDAKRAVSFVPQSDASAVQTEVLLRLATYPDILQWLALIIHDSFVLEVPETQAEYAAQIVYNEMVQPIPQLDGLSIGAEVTIGHNLAKWDVVKNPSGMKDWEPKR